MDFRPNTNTLVANYLVTFGIVGLIIYMSTRPGNVVTYYYSPEYNSHASYGTSNCASCHTSAWSKVTDKNCSTAGCHTQIEAGKQTTPERLAATKDEFGHDKPHWGAILAFHDKVIGQTSCESCHPSHRLPQKGRFNGETILASLEQTGGIPRDRTELARKRADAFHHGAELIAGKMSCNACHAAMDASGQLTASSAAAAAQQLSSASVPVTPAPPAAMSTPPPMPPVEPASRPGAASPHSGNIASGDLSTLPPISTGSDGTSDTQTEQPRLPNLFEAVGKSAQPSPSPRDDGSGETPN